MCEYSESLRSKGQEMNSELVVVTFLGEKDAWKAESALRMMRDNQRLGLQYAASACRTSTGESEIRLRLHLPVNLNDRKLLLLCIFANEFFPHGAESASRLVEAGLDKDFVDHLRDTLCPGTSALLIYAPPEIPIDMTRLETILSLFKGKFYHATFPENIGDVVFAHGFIDEDLKNDLHYDPNQGHAQR
jgi:hypothetical protein